MTEITMLALYGLLVIVTLLAQATGTMQQLGMGYMLSSRDEHRTVKGITARLGRALDNSVTAMVLFAPAVLLIVATDSQSSATALASTAFLIARVVYLPAYAFKITGIRTLAWTVGLLSTAILYLSAL